MDASLETTSYLIAGMIAIFGILGGYMLSLVIRLRRVKKSLKKAKNQKDTHE